MWWISPSLRRLSTCRYYGNRVQAMAFNRTSSNKSKNGCRQGRRSHKHAARLRPFLPNSKEVEFQTLEVIRLQQRRCGAPPVPSSVPARLAEDSWSLDSAIIYSGIH